MFGNVMDVRDVAECNPSIPYGSVDALAKSGQEAGDLVCVVQGRS